MNWPSMKVRETFVQYFLRHPTYRHSFIPSSSVVPKNDPSLAFVNAGMNQFKDVILGYGRPSHLRVTNSQKCLRINDLKLVGADTFHHTFFEMLGNWSFANYFKKEACVMAWNLLTNVYKLDPNRLYVTYFAGGESIPMDKETKEIWESIGVPPDRILPFGKENFWSMGSFGPCGPSSEIHYDHRGTLTDPSLVNQDSGLVVEIWNLVFMQYNRTQKDNLERLPLSHVVDTGAGLERLTAVLNEKISNYDTDLFSPLFDVVHKLSKCRKYTGSFTNENDTSYRVFADHIRAAVVALSDGVLPQTNHKVRRLIHRSFGIIHNDFLPNIDSESDMKQLIVESVDTVSNSLSPVYPEIEKMKKETIEILSFEAHKFLESLRKRETHHPSLPQLLTIEFPNLSRLSETEIERVKTAGIVDGETAFNWYESLGIVDEDVEAFCNKFDLKFDKEGLKSYMDQTKKKFRDEIVKELISSEERQLIMKVESLLALYKPEVSGGIFHPQAAELKEPIFIEWIFDEEGDPVEEIASENNNSYWIILNKTPFFPGSSIYVSDIGSIQMENTSSLQVKKVITLPSGWIFHHVSNVPEIGFSRKAKVVKFNINNEIRFGRGMSYSTLNQLKSWLKKRFHIVRFGVSFVYANKITLEVTLLKGELKDSDIKKCQDSLNEIALPIVIAERKWKKNGVYELVCATGLGAEEARRHSTEVLAGLDELQTLLNRSTEKSELNHYREKIEKLSEGISTVVKNPSLTFSFEVYSKTEDLLTEAYKLIEKHVTLGIVEKMAEKVSHISDSDQFVLESFLTDIELSSLKKITRGAEVRKKPVLVVLRSSDGIVQARCCFPKELATEDFCAERWLSSFVDELGRGSTISPKGQDPKFNSILKKIRVPDTEVRLAKGMEKAKEFMAHSTRYYLTSKSEDKSDKV